MEINLTEPATLAALEILKNENAALLEGEEKFVGVRIKVIGGGCAGFSYGMDLVEQSAVTASDKTFEFGELKIFSDVFSLQYLDGMIIDFVDNGLQGKGFRFNNPNTKSTCGCGSSFSP